MNPTTNKKVLILTGSAGYGHISIADSLQFWTTQWGFEPKQLHILPHWVDTTYKFNVKTRTNGLVFGGTNNRYISRLLHRDYNNSMEERVAEICPDYKDYDIAISTHPAIHPKFAKVNIMVIPDPVIHKLYMLKPQPDYYVSYWKKGARYVFLGPLARKGFYDELKHSSKETLKRNAGFDPNKTTAIILAGGEWIGRSRDYLDILGYAFDPNKYEFVFICGKNEKFKQDGEKEYSNTNFTFLGWKSDSEMNAILRAGNFGICFSTGSGIVIESGICKLPLYVVDNLGGQEEEYVKIIERYGVGKNLRGGFWDKLDRLREYTPKTNKIFDEKNLVKWSDYLLARPKEWELFFRDKITGQ